MTTNVETFIGELDGGVFADKLSRVLSEVAGACVDMDKPGKVSIELSFNRIGSSYQVQVSHKLAYERPTAKGKVSEVNKTSTPMHVGKGGSMSLFPENQSQMFTVKGDVANQHQHRD